MSKDPTAISIALSKLKELEHLIINNTAISNVLLTLNDIKDLIGDAETEYVELDKGIWVREEELDLESRRRALELLSKIERDNADIISLLKRLLIAIYVLGGIISILLILIMVI